MAKTIKIGIAEDHDLVRQGLVALFEDEPGVKVKFDVENGAKLLEELKSNKVDVVLLDLDMPVVDGREALQVITDRYSKLKAIIVSMHYEENFIAECIAEGARGFLPKNCDFEKVVEAIHMVHEKGFYFDEKVSQTLVSEVLRKNSNNGIRPNRNPLTVREIEIIKLVCEGKKNREIAELLHLSSRTVEGHRQKIFEKTDTSNIAELVVFAIKNEIFAID